MRRSFPRTGFQKPGQYREAVATVWQNLRDRLRIRPRSKPATKPATRPAAGARHRPGPPPGRHLEYSPRLDGRADPGEIVWTWVPYEEDHRQGKDRPVLVVGRDRRTLYGLMLSSN